MERITLLEGKMSHGDDTQVPDLSNSTGWMLCHVSTEMRSTGDELGKEGRVQFGACGGEGT